MGTPPVSTTNDHHMLEYMCPARGVSSTNGGCGGLLVLAVLVALVALVAL